MQPDKNQRFQNGLLEYRAKENEAKNDTSRTRTDASEESRFLIYRLRPLGHSV